MTNYMTKESINHRIKEHFEAIKDDYEVMGVFLKGSQNYIEDMFYEGSDVDSVAVVMPTKKQILLGIEFDSKTKFLENEEQITVVDARKLISLFKKGSMNNLEPLFTEYFFIKEKYKDFFNALYSMKEEIAYSNKKNMAMFFMGISFRDKKNLEKAKTQDTEIEKYGYSRKRLSNILRFNKSLKAYLKEEEFSKVLKSTPQEEIYSIRREHKYSLEEARKLSQDALKETKDLAVKYEYTKADEKKTEETFEKMDEILMDLLIEILKQA